jgi:hypothetical protein
LARISSWFSMMPLCTTETPPEMCGCAFLSEGTPCVAQRVWPMPMLPCRPCAEASFSSSATRPQERRRCMLPLITATPAES